MSYRLFPVGIAQYPRLSNLFTNNKACLGSARLLVRDRKYQCWQQSKRVCWEERGRKLVCHLPASFPDNSSIPPGSCIGSLLRGSLSLLSPHCHSTVVCLIEDQASTWVLAETSHTQTTADIACFTWCLQPGDLSSIVSSAAFEKFTKKSICAEEELGGGRCWAGLLTLTYVLFYFQNAFSQDWPHTCWVSAVNI